VSEINGSKVSLSNFLDGPVILMKIFLFKFADEDIFPLMIVNPIIFRKGVLLGQIEFDALAFILEIDDLKERVFIEVY
jgi:hypothetical protein